MDSSVFVVVTGPDGISTATANWRQDFYEPHHFSLLTAHLTQNRGQHFHVPASALLLPLSYSPFLISPTLISSRLLFWLTCLYPNPEHQIPVPTLVLMLVWDNVLLLLAATKNNRERVWRELWGCLGHGPTYSFLFFFKSVNSLEEFVVSLGKAGETGISL